MRKLKDVMLVTISAIIITLLFYKKALGINLLIYEVAVISYLLYSKQLKLKGLLPVSMTAFTLITGVFTVIHHSTLSFFVNFLVFFLMIGAVIAPEVKSIWSTIQLAFLNLFSAQSKYLEKLSGSEKKNKKFWFTLWRMRIFLIPLVIILFFVLIYSWSNPKFGELMDKIGTFINDQLAFLFEHIDLWIVVVFLVGVVISSFVFLHVRNKSIIEKDAGQTDELIRKKTKWHVPFKLIALKNEYRAAVFLFFSLNVLLLILNILDVNSVWINFEWSGQYLKQFVHEGTYLLIGAIIISIVLVLHYFRANLNFYSKNKWLKYLSYFWLAQNAFLVISVGIRNWHYIQHFALAYKRIAVMFYLLLTLFGLYTVIVKVMKRKSRFYLVRTNFYAWIVVYVMAAGFNWDRIIADYNFRNADKSFVHLDFLSDLSDNSIPYLIKTKDELANIKQDQERKFSFGSSSFGSYGETYMRPEIYYQKMRVRKLIFKKKWEGKGWLEWNWAESKAYQTLYSQQSD